MVRSKILKNRNLESALKHYGWLFKLHGIQIENKKYNFFPKVFLFFRLILMHFFFIYFLCMYDLIMSLSTSLYFVVSTTCFISVGVWYLFKFKAKELIKMIMKMNSMPPRYNLKTFKCKFVNLILIVIFCVSLSIILLNVYHLEIGMQKQKRMFTFNTDFPSYFSKFTARLFLFSSYFVTLFTFPVISTLFPCLMYYHLSTVILQCRQKWKIKLQELSVNTKYVSEVVYPQLSELIKLAKELDKALYPLSFLLLSLQITLLFGYTVSIVNVGVSNMDFQQKLEVFSGVPISLAAIISITTCAYLVEKRFDEVKEEITFVHEIYVHHQMKDNFALELIRYMIFLKFPVMTALPGIKFNPSLIFSCIGISLTFGLLSIQLFDQST